MSLGDRLPLISYTVIYFNKNHFFRSYLGLTVTYVTFLCPLYFPREKGFPYTGNDSKWYCFISIITIVILTQARQSEFLIPPNIQWTNGRHMNQTRGQLRFSSRLIWMPKYPEILSSVNDHKPWRALGPYLPPTENVVTKMKQTKSNAKKRRLSWRLFQVLKVIQLGLPNYIIQ